MKLNHIGVCIAVCAVLLLFFCLVTPLCAQDSGKCSVCGMNTSQFPHTRYMVESSEGKSYPTCGVQCGLTLNIRLGDKWKSAIATDLLSSKPFDAQKGFYVYKSSVITDMSPGFIAFAAKENAEKFVKGFGGQVLTYSEALEAWKKVMK